MKTSSKVQAGVLDIQEIGTTYFKFILMAMAQVHLTLYHTFLQIIQFLNQGVLKCCSIYYDRPS